MNRIMLTALKSNSGKTLITCGLLYAFKQMGKSVCSYKCGPDYIDPLFHQKVIGIPSENIDSHFQTEEQMKEILSYSQDKDIAVMEGAMGIYDGMALTKKSSAYEISAITNTPIILIIDAKGMGNTITSLIKGILLDDTQKMIKGIILNNISKGYYEKIAPIIEAETKLCIVGYLPKVDGVNLDSRHLGLKLPHEIEDLEKQLKTVADTIAETIDIEKLLELSKCETGNNIDNSIDSNIENKTDNFQNKVANNDADGLHNIESKPLQEIINLAVAKDEVFCFLYEDNLRVLKKYGVTPVFFSPLHDEKLPENVSGILLPGGYPELRLAELSKNESMKESIKNAIENGMPSLAECGGFIYLHDIVKDNNDNEYKMVGAVHGTCYNTGSLCRFGYVDIKADRYEIKGHEFHYYDSTDNGTDILAKKSGAKNSWKFGYLSDNKFWGFPHLYYRSCEEFVENFVAAMQKYSCRVVM